MIRRLIQLEAVLDAHLFADIRRPYRDYDEKHLEPGSIASVKLDGIYARADKTGLYSRSGKKIEGQDHVSKRLKRHFRKNPDSKIEGELYRKQPLEKTAEDLRGGKKLKLHMFPGQGKLPLGIGAVRKIKGKPVSSTKDADRHYRKALKKGHEGLVIQTPSGERIRRKPLDDSEFDVSEIKAGRKGGRIAHVSDGKVGSKVLIPGGSKVKAGDRITVQHQGTQRSGKLRHPRYKAVRDYD